jgi:hypothetical protein
MVYLLQWLRTNVSCTSFKCFIYFQTYVANVSSRYFKSISSVAGHRPPTATAEVRLHAACICRLGRWVRGRNSAMPARNGRWPQVCRAGMGWARGSVPWCKHGMGLGCGSEHRCWMGTGWGARCEFGTGAGTVSTHGPGAGRPGAPYSYFLFSVLINH